MRWNSVIRSWLASMWMVIAVATCVSVGARCAAAEPVNLIANGDFKDGATGWDGAVVDADKSVAVATVQGAPAMVLKRITDKTPVAISHFNLKFKPQMLYKLSVTGFGKDGAGVGLRPSSSKDKEYFKLCQSWATSSAVLAKADAPVTSVFYFDSGLKVDSAFVSVHLPDGGPMEYTVMSIQLEELTSTAPEAKEFIIGHIGDSFSATSYLPFDDRIDRLLQQRIDAKVPQGVGGRKVRNVDLGVDGEYLKELTDTGRYEKAIHEQYAHFDLIFIRYGANDRRFYKPDEFNQRLGNLCTQLEKDYPGVKIVIGAGLWLKDADEVNKQYEAYWQASRDLAAARKYPLADLYAAFKKTNADDLTIGKDNMHPSAKGVQVIADAEFAVIEPLLTAK